MSSMLINHFGFKRSVMSFSLGGMGCANGVVAVNLVMDLLKVWQCWGIKVWQC